MLRNLVLAVLVLLLLVPDRGAAQDRQVIGTSGDVRVAVDVSPEGDVCLAQLRGRRVEQEGGCARPPVSPYAPGALTGPGALVGLVVDQRVATVAAEGRRTPTVAVAGAPVRAVLLRVPRADTILRFLAADDSLLGAAQDLGFADRTGGRVLRRSAGVVFRGMRSTQLLPDPLRPDNAVPITCLSARGGYECTDDAGRSEFGFSVTDACAPQRAALASLLPDAVRRVRVVFGDGSVRTVGTRAFPAAVGPGRYLGLALPRGLAVRRVLALGASGRVLRRDSLAAPPTSRRCTPEEERSGFAGSGGGIGLGLTDERIPAPVTPPVGVDGGALAVADGRDPFLCVRVAGRERATCTSPPVDAETTFLEQEDQTVGGAVARDVTTVRVELDDGQVLTVPTTPGAGYGGRYAGLVRFVTLDVPAGRRAEEVTAIDAAGADLGPVRVAARSHPDRITSRSRRVAPGVRLVRYASSVEDPSLVRACLRVPTGRDSFGPDVCASLSDSGSASAGAATTCVPRRVVALGGLPRGATGARLVLAGGGRVPARVLRLPGVPAAWTAIPPRDATVVGVHFDGRLRPQSRYETVTRRLPLPVPPAAEQCGFGVP